MNKTILASGLLLLLMTTAVQAAPIIEVGNNGLLPNQAGQQVQIFVSGGDAVQGLNLNAQVADGGPGAGVIDGPDITSGDILTGTIFDGNNTGQGGGGVLLPQVYEATTTTSAGTVPANGLLVTLTFDTTGFNSGSWDLILSSTLNGPTDFAGLSAVITDGSIFIIPEPASIALIGFGSLMILRRRR